MKFEDILEAEKRIGGVIHNTPLEYSDTFSKLCGANVYIKLENMQKTGSFKVRGAYNCVSKICEGEKPQKIIACSAGNHAQGVAYAASALGVGSTIVMPRSTPIAKILATESYGAEVLLHGDFYDDSYEKALELSKEEGTVFVHPFDDECVIAGQGTIALEILKQKPDIDTIVVPAGGGGLLAGIALGAKKISPHIRVFGVQASRANSMALSFNSKKLVNLNSIYTIADGIAVKNPGKITYPIIMENVDDIVTVSDDEIAASIIYLIERTKLIAEPAGAAALAAVISGKIKGGNIACVLSGGNIDMGMISKIIEKGLISRGRKLTFAVVLMDKPGTLEKISRLLAENNANIVSIHYDRTSSELELNETILHIECEVGGFEHGRSILKAINENGYKTF